MFTSKRVVPPEIGKRQLARDVNTRNETLYKYDPLVVDLPE